MYPGNPAVTQWSLIHNKCELRGIGRERDSPGWQSVANKTTKETRDGEPPGYELITSCFSMTQQLIVMLNNESGYARLGKDLVIEFLTMGGLEC